MTSLRIAAAAVLTLALLSVRPAGGQSGPPRFDTILYGASYYWEYQPLERLDKDFELMAKAGLSVIRVGESTWGVLEPSYLNFSPHERAFVYDRESGRDILSGTAVAAKDRVVLGPWDLVIVRAGR
jgi:hypothetical protein